MKKIDIRRRKKVLRSLTILKGVAALMLLSLFGKFIQDAPKKATKEVRGPAYWS